MKIISEFKKRPLARLGLFVATMLLSQGVQAQDWYKYDSLATKYKNEHAVYTNFSGKLVITIEDGNLVANNYSTIEKLYLDDQSLNTVNREYFEYGDFNQLTGYSALTYLPARGKTYKRVGCNTFGSGRPADYTFYDDSRIAVAYFSGLQKRAITETRYSTENTDVHMLSGFIFQDYFESLPIAYASYEVIVPRNVNMEFSVSGSNTAIIKKTTEEKNGRIHYLFTATDIPAAKSFENIPSWRHYMPHVIPYITSFRLDGAKKDSIVSRSPDDLYKYLYNYVRGINFKTDSFITKTVAEITKDDVTPAEKAAHIYKWVQENIHYVAIENGLEGFVPRPADTVYKRMYGDCKDMASICQAMCRKAGVNAYFAWIGTDHMPYKIEDVPLNVNFNHMICAVKDGDDWVFLDGTNRLQPYGCNREDIQGKQALISIDEHNYKIVSIPVEPAEKNVTVDSSHIAIAERKIEGSLSQAYTGHDAMMVGYKLLYNKKKDDREKMIRALTLRGSDKYTQKKFEAKTNKSGKRDVTVNVDFVVEDYVMNAGKKCFVNMNLLHHFEDAHIDMKDRNVPWHYDYKSKHKEVVVLDIPKGYKVDYLPAPVKGSLDNVWNYTITYTADKKHITLTKEYEVNALSINPDRFAANNKLVDDLRKSYRESVVLTTN